MRWNVLTTVHRANEDHGLDVYRFLRDDLGTEFVQLIAIVERPSPGGIPTGDVVTDRSASPAGYGRFLVEVFEEWVRHDVGTVFVQMFDSTLASFAGVPGSLCVHSETCGTAVALEHNGDLYSYDHFVEPGLHYLCPSYQDFFRHVDRPMRFMVAALRSGKDADEVMAWSERNDRRSDRRSDRDNDQRP